MEILKALSWKLILFGAVLAIVFVNLFSMMISSAAPNLSVSMTLLIASALIGFFIAAVFKALISPQTIVPILISIAIIVVIVALIIIFLPQIILFGSSLGSPIENILRGGA